MRLKPITSKECLGTSKAQRPSVAGFSDSASTAFIGCCFLKPNYLSESQMAVETPQSVDHQAQIKMEIYSKGCWLD